ncbi:MAG: alpha/beta hydrolase [Actinomycetes bacterium]
MATATRNNVTIEYAVHGDPEHPVVLFIMGFGSQMIAWDQAFIDVFTSMGFCAITYDNRDTGLSTIFDDHGLVDVLPALLGEQINAPYDLADMARDGIALLDELGIEQAHVVGVSMGGMIAQQLVIDHPHRVTSLISIMSTTGGPFVGQPSPEALASLLLERAATREEAIEQSVSISRIIASPAFPFDEDLARTRAAAAYDRSYTPDGANRHMAAMIVSGDRTEALKAVTVPTLVLHGQDDPLVHVSGGEATAAAMPNVKLKTYEGMGHDLPMEHIVDIVGEMLAHLNEHTAVR